MTHYWNKTYRKPWLNPCKHSFEILCLFQESNLVAEKALEKQNRIKKQLATFLPGTFTVHKPPKHK